MTTATQLPLKTFYANKEYVDVCSLLEDASRLSKLLYEQGALLFRDFNVHTSKHFKAIANMFAQDLMSDNGEHNPIDDSNGVFTPVSYSAKEKLLWHNENSFNKTWPLMIIFGAHVPAIVGGETPIVNSHDMLDALDPAVVEEFQQKGVMYVRTHGFGVGRSWQETFRVNTKIELEQKCHELDVVLEWHGSDKLVTRQVRPAIVEHPITGVMSWFNQAQHWHPACLQESVRNYLLKLFGAQLLPRQCYFGDGSVISDETIQHILDVYGKLEVSFPWRSGDVMVLDNVLYAHARNPYEGERMLFVTMGHHHSF